MNEKEDKEENEKRGTKTIWQEAKQKEANELPYPYDDTLRTHSHHDKHTVKYYFHICHVLNLKIAPEGLKTTSTSNAVFAKTTFEANQRLL